MKKVSALLYKLSSVWSGLIITLIYAWFIATVMPEQSAESYAYAGDWGAPDRHLFYTPDELYSAIGTWGEAGRNDYINFRLGADIVWALAYTGFLVIWISCALRYAGLVNTNMGKLNVFPLLTLFSDYIENALGIVIASSYPERLDALAWLASFTTGFKWITLTIAHVVLLIALTLALRARLKR